MKSLDLKKFLRAAGVPLAFTAVAAIAACGVVYDTPAAPESPADVKVVLADGHGSGFHIGDGYVLTAAHVVRTAKEVEILTADKVTDKAEVLWVNKARDVALLRLNKIRPKSAELSCRTPQPGEQVEARGNPATIDFVSTWGQVAGAPRQLGPWMSVVPLSMTIVPGQSGGPLYDASGEIIGMNVGVMTVPVGPSGFVASIVGIGYAVPGTVLCDLLAKV